MFDSQKLSFENFLTGLKHGIYVFTSDSCAICQDYKNSISFINNHYLYFVEVVTEKEKAILQKLVDRTAFPITVGYKDNEIQFVRVGMLFDLQMKEIMKYLEDFGNEPLSPNEIKEKMYKINNRCLLTYYIFPENISEEDRNRLINIEAEKHNELPIDVERVGIGLSNKQRERMLEGNYKFAKMIVFENDSLDNITSYSEFAQSIIIGYSLKNQEVKFFKRKINEVN